MKSFICLLVAIIAATTLSEKIETDDAGVLVLTKDNFEQAISENEFILVQFYAPWCGHCKALKAHYAKASRILQEEESKIKLAKVDATEQAELAEKHGVRGYPTLKFFNKGEASEYSGGREAEEIVSWLRKRTGPPALPLNTVDEAKKFVESNTQNDKVAVIGFFKNQEDELAKVLIQTALAIDDTPFAITSEQDVFDHFNSEDGKILVVRNFDDGPVTYDGAANKDDLKKFISINSLPLLINFNHDTAQKIFGGDIKSHLLLFLDSTADDYNKHTEAARSVAKPFKNDIAFVVIDSSDPEHSRILEFFAMKVEDVPAARIIKLEEDMSKYKPENKGLEAEDIKSFVQDFLDGKLKQHLLSEDLPEDWDKNPVTVLVASNFDEVALDPTKDVLVEFYAPWCGHCKQLEPIYVKVGEHFNSNDNVIIAKMDATTNELEHTKVKSFPTIKFYPKGNHDATAIEYTGPRTFEGLVEFVESGGVEKAEVAGEDLEEDDDHPRKDEL